jgi:hypothetical protein
MGVRAHVYSHPCWVLDRVYNAHTVVSALVPRKTRRAQGVGCKPFGLGPFCRQCKQVLQLRFPCSSDVKMCPPGSVIKRASTHLGHHCALHQEQTKDLRALSSLVSTCHGVALKERRRCRVRSICNAENDLADQCLAS